VLNSAKDRDGSEIPSLRTEDATGVDADRRQINPRIRVQRSAFGPTAREDARPTRAKENGTIVPKPAMQVAAAQRWFIPIFPFSSQNADSWSNFLARTEQSVSGRLVDACRSANSDIKEHRADCQSNCSDTVIKYSL